MSGSCSASSDGCLSPPGQSSSAQVGAPPGRRSATSLPDARRGTARAPEAAPQASLPGLVSSSTSEKCRGQGEGSHDGVLTFDVGEARVRQLRRGVLSASRLVQEDLCDREVKFRAAFFTFTYADGEPWDPRDITATVTHMRKYALRRWDWHMPYVWVAEIQEQRKAQNPDHHCLHYHMICWLPRGCQFPLPDKQGWWTKGHTKSQWARSPVGYMAKYASKAGLTGAVGAELRGLRVWGRGGLTPSQTAQLSWALAPGWLRKLADGWDTRAVKVRKVVREVVEFGKYGREFLTRVQCYQLGAWVLPSPWRFDGASSGEVSVWWRGWGADDVALAGAA